MKHPRNLPSRTLCLNFLCTLLLCASLGGLLALPSAASERTEPTPDPANPWSGWRGADRSGAAALDVDWSATGLEEKWSQEVGLGHSSPVSDGERVFVFARRGEDEVAAAYALETGQLLWSKSLPAPRVKVSFAARKHGKGPKATPLLTGDLLVTYGMTGIVTGWEAATGKLRFRVDLADDAPTPDFGVASSPVAATCGIVVVAGSEKDGAVVCLDAANGSTVWTHSVGASYASPLAATFDGVEQIVHLADAELVGLDAATGARLWEVPYERSGYAQNEATPLLLGGDVLVAGEKRPTHRLAVTRSASGWSADVIWSAEETAPEMSSPVPSGDLVVVHSHLRKGSMLALDASTGSIVWQGDARYGEHSSLVALGNRHVLSLRSEGELVVFERDGNELREVLRREVAPSPTWAHPLVTNRGLWVKDLDRLRFLAFSPR
ncbi:MAG: PQQ-binding-like beta-propeller repeat protein [Acidobacteriota bacterium]